MTDKELAVEIISRLNRLAENPDIAADLNKAIELRSPASRATIEHPTIQARNDGVGWLGILNGIVGIRETGCGYIAAKYSDDECLNFVGFVLTKQVDEATRHDHAE